MGERRPVDQLRDARRGWREGLLSLPNVLGTGLGIKRQNGIAILRTAIVVFVGSKVSNDSLLPKNRVPQFVFCDGRRIPTDVVEIGRVRLEFGGAPYALTDSETNGTLSAFAEGDNQELHGVSCAHCLIGEDGDPYVPSTIKVWDTTRQRFADAGRSGYVVDSPGFGLPTNYGFSDIGLFHLEHPVLVQRASKAPILPILANPRRGMRVIGQTLTATLTGTIDAIEATVDNLDADIVVRVGGPGTRPGFSGMLWRTESGQAVGVHAWGAAFDDQEDSGSRFSLSMAARRIEYQLQVRLRDPGLR